MTEEYRYSLDETLIGGNRPAVRRRRRPDVAAMKVFPAEYLSLGKSGERIWGSRATARCFYGGTQAWEALGFIPQK